MHIYRPDRAEAEVREIAGNPREIYRANRAMIAELVGGFPERVAVLFKGEPADMFVEEESARKFVENPAATAIYWTAARERGETPAPDWPRIHGTAVLFEGRVWF